MTGVNLADIWPYVTGLVGAAVAWGWQVYVHREEREDKRHDSAAEVDKHRDDLALRLLSAATEEVQQVRTEIDAVRQENRALRALEEHFYHFQQALGHLEAVLTAADADERTVAERNATSFLARMRRLQQAKGNIQNEIQVVESANRLNERDEQ